MIKQILLTGSGGFIGKNLKNALENRYILHTPRSFELNLKERSSVSDFFKSHQIDYIIHCASVGGMRGQTDQESIVSENLHMLDNLLQSKKKEVPLLFFGSGSMYNRFRHLHKVSEEEIGIYIPTEPYGKAKMLASQYAKKDPQLLCLNIFSCYGYYEKPTRFPTHVMEKMLRHEDVIIEKNAIFDYLWIEDLVKIIAHFIEHKPSQNILNLTPSQSISLQEMALMIQKITKSQGKVLLKDQTLHYEYTGSNKALLQQIGDFQFTPLQEGLEKFYNFYLRDSRI